MSLVGAWRISEMQTWDQEAIELLGPAFIEFDDDGLGRFRFIAVEGFMDCRYGHRDGRASAEFSWAGQDDCDPASGRGWAALEKDGTLRGHIFIHNATTRPSARPVCQATRPDAGLRLRARREHGGTWTPGRPRDTVDGMACGQVELEPEVAEWLGKPGRPALGTSVIPPRPAGGARRAAGRAIHPSAVGQTEGTALLLRWGAHPYHVLDRTGEKDHRADRVRQDQDA